MRSNNAQQALINAAMANPQFAQVLQMIKGGINPKTLAENIAQVKGEDLNKIINLLMK